jgi:hypothetical protein
MGKCSNAFFSETTNMIKTKLPRNDHWKVLYKFMFFMPIGNPRWPPPQDHLVEDLPMIIPGQFGFNYPSGFREAF